MIEDYDIRMYSGDVLINEGRISNSDKVDKKLEQICRKYEIIEKLESNPITKHLVNLYKLLN